MPELRFPLVALLVASPIAAATAPARAQTPDSAATAAASTPDSAGTRGDRRPKRDRLPVTPELDASAFASPAARALLVKARDARLRQDSSIVAYDATRVSRITVGFGVRSVGRDRILARSERADRIRWQRDVGAYVDLVGARSAVPMFGGVKADFTADTPSLPYYPGRETLWVGAGLAKADVNPDELIHPLANGSEAYYRYAVGDSLTLDIGGGRRITLRELRVSARRPEWRLIVGSFWFDDASGQLVRAAYRFSTEMDIKQVAEEDDEDAFEDVPLAIRPLIFPLKASLEGVTIEYGLFGGVWMPRTQVLVAAAQASFARVPVRFEERYRYASVNARDATLPPISRLGPKTSASANVGITIGPGASDDDDDDFGPDSVQRALNALPIDSLERRMAAVPSPDSLQAAYRDARTAKDTAVARRLRREAARARRDSLQLDRALQCRREGFITRRRVNYGGTVPTLTRTPCDRAALAASPELPPSLFSPGEQLFGAAEREALLSELSFDLQAGWAPQRPKVEFSFAEGSVRYNRIEGLSVGTAVSQVVGLGWSWRVGARLGIADRQPLGEVAVRRSTGRREIGARVYRELATATDFGQPLAFGASLAALAYARDDGLYHRAWGAEVTWRTEPDGATVARGFVEQQTAAAVASRWSLTRGAGDPRFADNLAGVRGTWGGVDLRARRSLGENPDGWRLFTDGRLEAATGTSDYLRTLGEATVTRGLGRRAALSLTTAAGTTAGAPPVQRQFHLGGFQTVRGQFVSPGVPGFGGTAFWFGRSELALGRTVARPSVFYDVGWAGDRARFGARTEPLLRGAGVGASFLDGLVRFDVARGLAPVRQWRADFAVDVRF